MRGKVALVRGAGQRIQTLEARARLAALVVQRAKVGKFASLLTVERDAVCRRVLVRDAAMASAPFVVDRVDAVRAGRVLTEPDKVVSSGVRRTSLLLEEEAFGIGAADETKEPWLLKEVHEAVEEILDGGHATHPVDAVAPRLERHEIILRIA